MIIADTSGLIAFFSESGPQHEAVASWVEANDPVLVVSPYVVAEVDYLVATRKGVDAELAVLAELSGGAYELSDNGWANPDLRIHWNTKAPCAPVFEIPRSWGVRFPVRLHCHRQVRPVSCPIGPVADLVEVMADSERAAAQASVPQPGGKLTAQSA